MSAPLDVYLGEAKAGILEQDEFRRPNPCL